MSQPKLLGFSLDTNKHFYVLAAIVNPLSRKILRFWGKEILKHPETCIKAVEKCIREKQIAAYDVVDLEELEDCGEP